MFNMSNKREYKKNQFYLFRLYRYNTQMNNWIKKVNYLFKN